MANLTRGCIIRNLYWVLNTSCYSRMVDRMKTILSISDLLFAVDALLFGVTFLGHPHVISKQATLNPQDSYVMPINDTPVTNLTPSSTPSPSVIPTIETVPTTEQVTDPTTPSPEPTPEATASPEVPTVTTPIYGLAKPDTGDGTSVIVSN